MFHYFLHLQFYSGRNIEKNICKNINLIFTVVSVYFYWLQDSLSPNKKYLQFLLFFSFVILYYFCFFQFYFDILWSNHSSYLQPSRDLNSHRKYISIISIPHGFRNFYRSCCQQCVDKKEISLKLRQKEECFYNPHLPHECISLYRFVVSCTFCLQLVLSFIKVLA